MTRPRLFLPGPWDAGSRLPLDSGNQHYLLNVLRLKSDAPVLVYNGAGVEGEGALLAEGPEFAVQVGRTWLRPCGGWSISLAQALPKADKMDLVIQKATELGVRRILPFTAERSVPRLDGQRAEARRTRWSRIALEAGRQCRRADLPEIAPLVSFPELLAQMSNHVPRMLLWEDDRSFPLGPHLRRLAAEGKCGECWIVVGPEGGFSDPEIRRAQEADIATVGLGRHVLRTETAAIVAVTLIQYELGTLFASERDDIP